MQYFFIIVDMSAFKHKNYSRQLWKGNAEGNNFRKTEKKRINPFSYQLDNYLSISSNKRIYYS